MKQVFYSLSPSDTIQLLGIVASLSVLVTPVVSLLRLHSFHRLSVMILFLFTVHF